MPVKRHKAANIGCQATNQSGRPCAAPPTRDSHYCSLHLVPGRAVALGRRGGQRNRSTPEHDNGESIAVPATAQDVQRILAEAMAGVSMGEMNPKIGTALSYMGMALLKALEVADLEQRIQHLERAVRSADEVIEDSVMPPEPTPEECDRVVEASHSRPPAA